MQDVKSKIMKTCEKFMIFPEILHDIRHTVIFMILIHSFLHFTLIFSGSSTSSRKVYLFRKRTAK